ncbi:NADH-quinone oxidoreductase subunit NuoG [Candidatus Venteria ishoeyi]|uniref:NADH-quinone oxidoreductase subunit NuoG n=1 Tax=Candidatus Venteria ishoeyi TaxID=1899563 RepID=UPI0025A63FC7|nr:NADH-quinone oxidoreductase subunit NuoG [Candidatus Venteria ishoeyi]MDM8546164.1 NADH-quinone oxidoreductase subunit NuoG [Candidatus Venteria ishoeyi]
MATITIDGKEYQVESGQMLIDVADDNGIEIPRFCYHKKLSISANCRMCLVDVEKAPKPLPACATPIMDGMVVHTQSDKAKAAQKSVMEFLLINHPLDCPVCDQGGECELQDVAMAYGSDVSRFAEEKRVVMDKNLGPLIATEMTRCIHCTRCVRFSREIAGMPEMGATGRGEHTLVGPYIEKTIDSELSGNMVDVCPVGALTAKPSRFQARAWEMQQRAGIAPHDIVGSNLYFHIRNNKVFRVVPKENEAVNEVWLSDKDRFSYSALQAEDRLTRPMIKKEGQWQETDWESALKFVVAGLKAVINDQNKTLGGLASPTATLEELYLFQKMLRGMGSDNIDHRLRQIDFSDQDMAPLFPRLGQSIAALEDCDSVLVIGSNLRKEQPLLNQRLRKAAYNRVGQIDESIAADVMLLNPVDYDFNLPIAEKIITAPSQMVEALAGIAKALSNESKTATDADAEKLLANVSPSETQQNIAKSLLTAENASLLLGQLAFSQPDFAILRGLSGLIAKLSGAKLGYLSEAGNSAGAWLAGVLPHRGVGGTVVTQAGENANSMLSNPLNAYLLLDLEPELDSWNGTQSLETLKQADFVVSLSAFKTETMQEYADVLLPKALFAETSGTFVNAAGIWQSFAGAVSPAGEARPGWKILRVLANLLYLEGFEYTASDQIASEMRSQMLENIVPDQENAWSLPEALPSANNNGLQRLTEMGMYATDAMVRRATVLQKTTDGKQASGAHLHPDDAEKLNIQDGQSVLLEQNGRQAELNAVLDSRVSPGCVLLYGGQSETSTLADWYGAIQIKVL